MSGGKHLRAGDHDWEFSATELGDLHCRCECGHERLITGKLVRGRARPDAEWRTPHEWNEGYKVGETD